MAQQKFYKLFMIIALGYSFSGLTAGPNDSQPSIQGVRPGVSEDSRQQQRPNPNGREEIAMTDSPSTPYPRDGNFRMGDWDFHENWRYNRDAFYRGETQPEAYREEHPYGPGGIGYDADVNYGRNLRRYQELYEKNPTPENKARLNELQNPYHAEPYRGNYGEGSRNDDYYRR